MGGECDKVGERVRGMIRTSLCDLLGVEYPIIQGGMAWVATAELAAAVSEGGGLGVIASAHLCPEDLRREIRRVREMTEKPFGVNLYYLSPHIEEQVEIVCEERVPVVTTGAGNPGRHMGKFKSAGIKVIPVVGAVALAKRMEKLGADAIIAEGHEAGGHVGEITTMALVPQVVDAVSIPVIAAGGIADGRGMAAALALGAQGVQIGTRFVCAEECKVHQNYKEAILKARDRDTVVTGRYTGHPVRVLKNRLARELLRLEEEKAPAEEFEGLAVGSLRRAVEGDAEMGSLMAGQIAGLVKEIKPAGEIIREIVEEAAEVISGLQPSSPQRGSEAPWLRWLLSSPARAPREWGWEGKFAKGRGRQGRCSSGPRRRWGRDSLTYSSRGRRRSWQRRGTHSRPSSSFR